MEIRSLAPFGAEVIGARLNAVGAEIGHEIARHRVLIFRNADEGDDALVGFLSALGPMTFTTGETPVVGAPMLNVVSNVGRTVPPRSVFHTDTSYVAVPPAYTALRAVMLPENGGATVFSDQVGAARRLAGHWQHCLGGRTVLHRATGLAGQKTATRHPLFRQHPLTGERALFLSTPERCSALSDMDAALSARLVTALYRHSIRPAHLYRHHWRRSDVIVWDNRVTMHRADHSGVVGDRVLHRGMTSGEAPITV